MGQFLEFAGNHPLLFAAFILIALMIVMNESRRKLLGFKEVGVNEAVRLMNSEDALMLDVREDKEFYDGHVINAVHIPLGLLEGRLKEIDDHREKPVIVYCRTGQRSAKASSVLQRQGFKSVYKLNGGMMAWNDAGLPVKKR